MRNIITEIHEKVILFKFNRPEALNSLNNEMVSELCLLLKESDKNDNVACVVLTGNEKSFAGNQKKVKKLKILAGADIEEMSNMSYSDCLLSNHLALWTSVSKFRKPLIAAVNGYAVKIKLMINICYF